MADELIQRLALKPHPVENGYFGPILYKSSTTMEVNNTETAVCDVVYFLYKEGDFSPWHRMLYNEEFWTHTTGGSLEVFIIVPEPLCYTRKILQPLDTIVVPKAAWCACRPTQGAQYSLFSVLLSPGFNPDNFELPPDMNVYFDALKLSEEDLLVVKSLIK